MTLYKVSKSKFYEEPQYAELEVTVRAAQIPYGKMYVYIDDGKDVVCPICGDVE